MTMPIDTLLSMMQTLRGPHGCGWDKKQTLETLKKYLLEECYELIDALDAVIADEREPSIQNHKEELGDLLLLIVFQIRIQEEKVILPSPT